MVKYDGKTLTMDKVLVKVFLGEYEQEVSKYSAVKVKGKLLYKYTWYTRIYLYLRLSNISLN